ncbi:MAG: sigma-54-dependent Fis family transcriptional regulator [Desulfovermiculus sp.]|nr:sigma-54-dependent Fis family transcriptional regulator [Desulfovermiculus sp.]
MTTAEKPKILVVDDDSGHRITLKTVLKSWGYQVSEAEDGQSAVKEVQNTAFDLILMDVRMAVMNGIEALQKIKAYNPSIPVIIMTAYSSVESAVEAMKSGAYDYLTKPLDFDELQITIDRALEHTHLRQENLELKSQIKTGMDKGRILGTSPAMHQLMEMVSTVAPSEATVLITGESGTGKELITKAIQGRSNRSTGPLVTVNCAAMSESLLESELFGHEKGAFTGADRRREGRFVQADRGTIFLDEVGEMSMPMQAKILRVLQDGEIQRVGGDRVITVDVRVIAATNKDLQTMVSQGSFREDLYYRLNVVHIPVPPLRERSEDIPVLAQHFLNLYAERNKKKIKGFTPQAMDLLIKHPWPGNVRELENAVERAVILSPGEYISEQDLPANIGQRPQEKTHSQKQDIQSAGEGSLDDLEKAAVSRALAQAEGNKSEAARLLGITRRTLYNKLEKYGLDYS